VPSTERMEGLFEARAREHGLIDNGEISGTLLGRMVEHFGGVKSRRMHASLA
jgi:hypothetical protein